MKSTQVLCKGIQRIEALVTKKITAFEGGGILTVPRKMGRKGEHVACQQKKNITKLEREKNR